MEIYTGSQSTLKTRKTIQSARERKSKTFDDKVILQITSTDHAKRCKLLPWHLRI